MTKIKRSNDEATLNHAPSSFLSSSPIPSLYLPLFPRLPPERIRVRTEEKLLSSPRPPRGVVSDDPARAAQCLSTLSFSLALSLSLCVSLTCARARGRPDRRGRGESGCGWSRQVHRWSLTAGRGSPDSPRTRLQTWHSGILPLPFARSRVRTRETGLYEWASFVYFTFSLFFFRAPSMHVIKYVPST